MEHDLPTGPGDPNDPRPDARSDPDDTPHGEIVVGVDVDAVVPMRSPLALAGTVVTGFAMGVAEVMPGFSGGTVALVAGIYARLVAAIRQGARTLSLLVRGRAPAALKAFLHIDWLFITALLVGMIVAVFTLVETLQTLVEERPVELQAVFLGLVLGAVVVASRQLQDANAGHVLAGVVSAAVFFVLLGASPGTIDDPSLLMILGGGMIAVTAWILPGISGSFILLILGLWTPVIDAGVDRDLVVLGVFALGCVLGLAAFSTLLNWVLERAHDLVLAVLIGLMVGSARVLWPWPSSGGLGSAELGAPEGTEAFLALALALTAFALVWMLGLAASAIDRRRVSGEVAPQ